MGLPGGGYTGSAFGVVEADKFFTELWSGEVKRFRDSTFVMKSCINVVSGMFNVGDVYHVPDISRLAINDKIANTPVTLQTRTETEYTMTIDKYKEVSFGIEDVIGGLMGAQKKYDLRSIYTKEAGYAHSRDLDNFILGLRADIQGYNSQSNVVYVSSDGTATGTPQALNRAGILAAKQILLQASVPANMLKLVVGVPQYVDLLTITEFISADYVNNAPTVTGRIGSLYNMDVMMTDNIVTNSLTGYINGTGASGMPTPGVTGSTYFPTQSVTHFGTAVTAATLPANGVGGETDNWMTAMLINKEWARLAMREEEKVEASRENLFQMDAVVTTSIYGAKTFRPDHAVLIHTAP